MSTEHRDAASRPAPGQASTGLGLAALVIGAWVGFHVFGVFFYPWTPAGLLTAPLVVALLCWLDVGLFIIAHDAMHGSLAPNRPGLNRAIGRTALMLYAGFAYDRLRPKHLMHHRQPGTAADPDFHAAAPDRFRPWFLAFFRGYFGWREFGVFGAIICVYILVLGASPVRVLVFWAVPALLSAGQLFYFGTYRPHRPGERPFGDRHNARSNEFSWAMSLLTCFHFGYHHEHHLAPGVPWWRLPAERRRRLSPGGSTGRAAAAAR